MQFTKSIWALGALAAVAVAQDSSECDPQNDSNNDSTCTSSAAAASMTGSSSAAMMSSSSINEADITRLTSVDTNVIIRTEFDTNVMTSSLPASLNTVTTGILQTLVYTTQSVYTTNTLTSSGPVETVTGVISTSLTPEEATQGAGGAAGGNSNSDSSSSSSDSGAAPTGAAKYVYGGLAAGFMGIAAAL